MQSRNLGTLRATGWAVFLLAFLSSVQAMTRAERERLLADSNHLLQGLQKAGYLTMACEPDHNIMRVKVKVNDTPADLCVDTGATRTVISESIGRRAGLLSESPATETTILGVFGTQTRSQRSIRLDRLTLGPVRARNLPVVIRSGAYGLVDGLLGLDSLVQLGAVVDFGAGVLHLRRSSVPPGAVADILASRGYLRIALTNGCAARLTIREMEGWAEIDTGSHFSMIDRSLVRELHIPRFGTRYRISDVTGETRELEGIRLKDYQIDGTVPGPFDFAVVDMKEIRSAQEKPDGHLLFGCLGADFLTLNRAVIDCEAGQLYLPGPSSKPVKGTSPRPVGR